MSNSSVQPILIMLGGAASINPAQFMIEKAFARHELDWRYLTAEVAPERLGDAISGMLAMGFRGGHCAQVHKCAVVPLLSRASDCVTAVGAANVIFREDGGFAGENTEGKGAIAALRTKIDPAGKRVVLLGAGSLARAIGFELATAGAAEIHVINRTLARAQELAAMLTGRFPTAVSAAGWEGSYEVPAEVEIVIHAASRDHHASEVHVPMKLDSLRAGLVVADVSFDPPDTWLLQEAGRRGCTTLDGLSMFVEQMSIALHHWTGIDADRAVMRDAVEEFFEL